MAKRREEVAVEDRWDLETLYPDRDGWEQEYRSVEGSSTPPRWPHLAAFRGNLSRGADQVARCLKEMLSLRRAIERLYVYAHLCSDQDLNNPEHKSMLGRALQLWHTFDEENSWFEPELLALPTKKLESYLKAEGLKEYHFLLEKIARRKAHTLPAREEELIAMAAKPLAATGTAFSLLENADFRFNSVASSTGELHELTLGSYALHLRSTDRTLRRNSFITLHEKFEEFQNTCCELLQGRMAADWFDARAHHFKSTLESALFTNAIDPSVYDALINTVRNGVAPLHRYLRLRRKLLGVESLHPYDLYLPLVDWERTFSYQEAEKLVIESVAPLGKEYQALLAKGFQEDRWVDRYENIGKRSGGYSSGCYDSHPYILMNYMGTLNCVYTLAHEGGHSMHSLLSHTHQSYHDADYSIFVAEVASTFNEQLLSDLLMQRAESQLEMAYLVHQQIEGIRGTLFRQTLFADFERRARERVERGEPLTPQLLSEEYEQLNRFYYGSDLTIDPAAAFEWARIPHFYSRYYVYQYATGISAAFALHERVVRGGVAEQAAYLNFLKGGGSGYPLDLLKGAGVDMRTSEAVEAALRRFSTLVDQLEGLLG